MNNVTGEFVIGVTSGACSDVPDPAFVQPPSEIAQVEWSSAVLQAMPPSSM